MGSRESTRQELRDLAKLAASMPTERPASLPAAPVSRTAAAAPPTLQRPVTPSSISKLTVPPVAVTASIPPASMTLAPPVARKPGRRTGTVMVSAMLGVALAVAGGVQLGRSLAHRVAPVAAAAPLAPATSLPAIPAATAEPSLRPADPTPVATTTPSVVPAPVVAAAASPAPKTVVAPRRWTAGTRPAPKTLAATIPASGATPKDSLEDAIRKAVAATPPAH